MLKKNLFALVLMLSLALAGYIPAVAQTSSAAVVVVADSTPGSAVNSGPISGENTLKYIK